jgi:hypothetical protein
MVYSLLYTVNLLYIIQMVHSSSIKCIERTQAQII